jgi:hypothetical protein
LPARPAPASSIIKKSVKVPPTSMPMRSAIDDP